MKIIGIDDSEEKTKKLNMKKLRIAIIIATIILIFIVLFCIYLGNKNFRDFMDKYVLMKNVTENNVVAISLDDTENNNIYTYDKYICVFKNNTLTGYNSSANKEYELTVKLTNPIVDINNRFLLIAEENGQKIYLISGNNILWEKELEGNISKISVNKNGYVSVILTGTTYKSIIQTFDNNGNELFKTFISYTIAMDSDISNDNKYLSFVEINTSGTVIQSTVKTISMQKAKDNPSEAIIYTSTPLNDSVAISLKYQDSNKLVCMYDNSIHVINNGTDEEILNLNESGKKISFSDIRLNNFVFRVIEKNILLSTQSTVEIVNSSSKKSNIYTVDSVIKEVYCYNNVIALNLGSEVHFIGTNGWLIKKYISNQEVRKIVMNTDFAAVVYRDKVEIINL